MNLDKVITRFSAAPHERVELRRLARALGRELPREQLEQLRTFRAALARVPGVESSSEQEVDASSYAAGYVESMLDITVEYESHVQENLDAREVERMASREGWRDLLLLLRDGPKLPSELASALDEDRSRVTRMLQKLRAAGLVQAYAGDSSDGRLRPHRLTARGRQVAAGLDAGLSPEVACGIRVAVGLFRHLFAQGSTSGISVSALESIAGELLEDPGVAAEAVSVWTEEAQQASLLVSERRGEAATGEQSSDGVPRPTLAQGSQAVRRSDPSWQSAQAVIDEIKKRDREQIPVYVRTKDESWGAWMHAFGDLDAPGHTIVDGDLAGQAGQAIQPPEQRFLLVYEDPESLRADSEQPTMRAFMERAAGKFVVANPDDDANSVPEGFIALSVKR